MLFALAVFAGACMEPDERGDEPAFWSDVEPIEVARGKAQRGPWRMNESQFDYVDDPTVAVFDYGQVAVAWVDQARHDVFLQVYLPDGRARFRAPVNVSATPETFSWLPRLVVAPDNSQQVYALWQEIVFSGGSHGGEIFFARSTDGGATFGAPVNLSNSVEGDGKGRLGGKRWDNGNLDLALGPDGRLHAAWTEYEGRLLASHSANGGLSFVKPIHVDGDGNRPARAPAIEVTRDGVVHLAWSAQGEIRLASSIDGGRTFGSLQRVPSQGHADAPQLAAGPKGGLYLVYAESPDSQPRRFRIRFALLEAGSGSFSPPRTIAMPQSGEGSVHFPNLAVNEAGHVNVAWSIFPDDGRRARGWGFTVSRDGGRTFARGEVLPESSDLHRGSNGGLQGSLGSRIAVNDRGLVALVTSTFGRDLSHIWLRRRNSAGSPQNTGS